MTLSYDTFLATLLCEKKVTERAGQHAFNHLHSVCASMADAIRGSDLDPFYVDDRLPSFFTWVRENWDDYHRERSIRTGTSFSGGNDIEGEFEAIRRIAEILSPLNRPQIGRVLYHVNDRRVNEGFRSAIRLLDHGERKIACIKALREHIPNLTLIEAKRLTESTPVIIDVPAKNLQSLVTDLGRIEAKFETNP